MCKVEGKEVVVKAFAVRSKITCLSAVEMCISDHAWKRISISSIHSSNRLKFLAHRLMNGYMVMRQSVMAWEFSSPFVLHTI